MLPSVDIKSRIGVSSRIRYIGRDLSEKFMCGNVIHRSNRRDTRSCPECHFICGLRRLVRYGLRGPSVTARPDLLRSMEEVPLAVNPHLRLVSY